MKIRNLLPALVALCSFFASAKPAFAAGTNVLSIQPLVVTTFTLIPNGNFVQPATPLSVGSSPQSVAVADLNNDGKMDLVSANNDDGTLTVLINDGAGNFEDILGDTFAYEADSVNAVVAADVNGDGNVDLISANATSPTGTLTVFTNDGSGNFVVASSPVNVGRHPSALVAADIYGNGKPALIDANAVNNTLTVLTNMGGGIFVSNTSYAVGSQPESVTAADVNNDGKLDLICANFGDNNLIVLTNNGSGGFVSATTNNVGLNPNSVAAADVNGDGKVDLISANLSAGTLTVLTNAGGGHFVLAATLDASAGVGNNPFAVTAADVNGDGKVDLICANNGDSTLTVLTNDGSGGFVLASVVSVGANPQSVVTADIDGDGTLDLISANNGDNTLSVAFAAPTILTNYVNGIGISWSTNSCGFVLQQNSDLATTNWMDVPTAPIVTNELNQITVPFINGGQLFYRLRHP